MCRKVIQLEALSLDSTRQGLSAHIARHGCPDDLFCVNDPAAQHGGASYRGDVRSGVRCPPSAFPAFGERKIRGILSEDVINSAWSASGPVISPFSFALLH